jgi:hypothetical protein
MRVSDWDGTNFNPVPAESVPPLPPLGTGAIAIEQWAINVIRHAALLELASHPLSQNQRGDNNRFSWLIEDGRLICRVFVELDELILDLEQPVSFGGSGD